jgi:glutamate racemase
MMPPMPVSIDLLAGRAHAPGSRRSAEPRLIVFDSGLGGLTVQAEISKARPDADILYVVDDAGFPYGGWEEEALTARVVALFERLLAVQPTDCVVIACNTAATLVLPALRARFDVPFVGTVPAIKPAAWQTRSGLISVLATPGTVKRDYTRDLIREYAAGCAVTLVGSSRLAALAEAQMRGEPAPDAAILAEIAPCFVEERGADGALRRTDTVTLACTHYPLLLPRLRALAPWPVRWLDPAPAIARRVTELVGPPAPGAAARRGLALFTSGAMPSGAVLDALAARGLE